MATTPQATAPQTPASPPPPEQGPPGGAIANPQQILSQIRAQYPEYHDIDDKTLLAKMLNKHPEWRSGVPKNARQTALTQSSGVQKATKVTGPPSLGERVRNFGASVREALPTAGMVVGGLTGGIPGAALGGAGGEAFRQLTRRAQGLSAPATMTGAATDIAEEGAIGAATEGAGKLIAKPFERVATGVFKPAAGDVEAPLARQAAEKYGLKSTPQELAGKPNALSLKVPRSFVLGRMVGGKAQQENRAAAVTAIRTSLKKLTTNLMTGGAVEAPQAAGEATQGGLELSGHAFKQQDNALYRKVDQELQKLTKTVSKTTSTPTKFLDAQGNPISRDTTTLEQQGLQVNVAPLRTYMGRVLDSIKEIAPTLKGLAGQDKSLLSFGSAIQDLPDKVSFENANTLRSNLLSEIRKVQDLLPGKYKGLQKTIEKILDRQMETTAQEGGAPVLKAWREANSFHAEGVKVFQDSPIVSKILDKATHGENVFKLLKPDQATDAAAVMKAFDRYLPHADNVDRIEIQNAKNVFRQGYLSGMLKDSLEKFSTGKQADLKAVLDEHSPVLNVIMKGDPKAQAALTDLKQLSAFFARQSSTSHMSPWVVADALVGAASMAFGNSVPSVAQMLGQAEAASWITTKVLYNPTATRFLLDGMKNQTARTAVTKGASPLMSGALRAVRLALQDDQTPQEPQEPPQ